MPLTGGKRGSRYATAARKVNNKPTVNRSKVSELLEQNELLKEQNRCLQLDSSSLRARILVALHTYM